MGDMLASRPQPMGLKRIQDYHPRAYLRCKFFFSKYMLGQDSPFAHVYVYMYNKSTKRIKSGSAVLSPLPRFSWKLKATSDTDAKFVVLYPTALWRFFSKFQNNLLIYRWKNDAVMDSCQDIFVEKTAVVRRLPKCLALKWNKNKNIERCKLKCPAKWLYHIFTFPDFDP